MRLVATRRSASDNSGANVIFVSKASLHASRTQGLVASNATNLEGAGAWDLEIPQARGVHVHLEDAGGIRT